jgi:hypothetical protein
MTLNIWARSGPYAVREPLLRAGLAQLAPDVVALQEVNAGPGDGNQAEELLGPLGYQVDYEYREGENVGDPGIAVASRHPMVDRRLIELPHGGVAVAARVQAPEGAFWFCCASATAWLPGLEAWREDDAVALDAALRDIADPTSRRSRPRCWPSPTITAASTTSSSARRRAGGPASWCAPARSSCVERHRPHPPTTTAYSPIWISTASRSAAGAAWKPGRRPSPCSGPDGSGSTRGSSVGGR